MGKNMKWEAPLLNKEAKRLYAPSLIDREHTFSYENSNKCWNINDLIIYLWFNVSKNVRKDFYKKTLMIIINVLLINVCRKRLILLHYSQYNTTLQYNIIQYTTHIHTIHYYIHTLIHTYTYSHILLTFVFIFYFIYLYLYLY